MQAFLAGCRYASDESLIGEKDYWSPPEEFEKRRQGDCDCAAIWAWRQLIEMGIEARFVLGLTGTARGHHAWVFFRDDGEWYALEPFAAIGGRGFPQLHTLWYLPRFSAAWDGAAVRYLEHSEVVYRPSLLLLIKLTAASIGYHAYGWARVIFMLLRVLPKAGLNALRRGRRNNGKRLTLG